MPLITVLAGSQGSECGISLNNQDCRIKTRRQEQRGGHTAAICVAAVLGGERKKMGAGQAEKRAASSCSLERARLAIWEGGREGGSPAFEFRTEPVLGAALKLPLAAASSAKGRVPEEQS